MPDIIHLIRTITPLKDSENVYPSTFVEIDFIPQMDKTRLNKDTVYLVDPEGSRPEAHYNYRIASRALILSFEVPLKSDTLYTIHVVGGGKGVRDIMGNYSYRHYEFPFKTGVLESAEPIVPDVPDVPGETGEEPPITPPVQEPPLTFSLLNSFPEKNGILVGNTIALAFSSPVKSSEIGDWIQLTESPISPLLQHLVLPVAYTIEQQEDPQLVYLTLPSDLLAGKRYQLVLKQGLPDELGAVFSQREVIEFSVQAAHFYTDIKKVRLSASRFADEYNDIDIAEFIQSVSSDLYYQMSFLESFLPENWSSIQIPFGAEQYVRFNVVYQMALGQSLSTSSGSREEIRLGDLTVAGSGTTSSSLVDLLDLLQHEIQKWWRVLNGLPLEEEESLTFVRAPQTGTKAITDYPYPDFQTRVPFNELGGG